MKKKETPYLDFYLKCIKTGYIKEDFSGEIRGQTGLCNNLKDGKYLLQLFTPQSEDLIEYNHRAAHWGVDWSEYSPKEIYYGFNEFRQTVVLFLAAINNEL